MTYEPGTVAVATVRGVPNVRVFHVPGNTPVVWLALEHGWVRDSDVTDVRPLVVLDLYDPAAQAQRLRNLYGRQSWADEIADQIEAQTRPPKPPEPTGLGAVVRDNADRLWVRTEGFQRAPRERPVWHDQTEGTSRERYTDLGVVEVLSEGVPA